jgi:hypothetical protein
VPLAPHPHNDRNNLKSFVQPSSGCCQRPVLISFTLLPIFVLSNLILGQSKIPKMGIFDYFVFLIQLRMNKIPIKNAGPAIDKLQER